MEGILRVVAMLIAMMQGGPEDAKCILTVTTDWSGDQHSVSAAEWECFAIDDFFGMENPFFPEVHGERN